MGSEMNDTDRKKIVIIGGGVAGLSAGIFGQRAGFDTVIYEKNDIAGGSCSGWYRDGYAIDNCLHWLTGTQKGTLTYDLWHELGVLNDDTRLVKRDYFWASEYYGEVVHLWPDPERTREEMLRIAPKDADEINAFIDFSKIANDAVSFPKNGPKDIADTISSAAKVIPPREFLRRSMRYMGLRNTEWAKRFKSPLIQRLILDFCPKEYESYWLILAYSFYIAGNGDILEGGSIKLARTLVENYKAAGGRLITGEAVKKVRIARKGITTKLINDIGKTIEETTDLKIDNGLEEKLENKIEEKIDEIIVRKADGVVLENGEFEEADYVIVACDEHYVFGNLLSRKYAPLSLKEIYRDKLKYTYYSAFHVAFALDSEFPEVPDSLSFPCEQIEAGFQKYKRIGVKNYRKYGDYIAPKGETVIQVSLDQYEKDCRYWKKLYESGVDNYNTAKKNVAEAIKNEIEKKFPQYEGRLRILDIWTPYSYLRRNNDTHGAFMRPITTALSVNAFLPQEIKGLDNVFLAGHFLRYPGGLPTAAQTGKDAIELILSKK